MILQHAHIILKRTTIYCQPQRPPTLRWNSENRWPTRPVAITAAPQRRWPQSGCSTIRIHWSKAMRPLPYWARRRTQRHRWPALCPGDMAGVGPRCPTAFGAAASPGRNARTHSHYTHYQQRTARISLRTRAAAPSTTQTLAVLIFIPRASTIWAARILTMPWTVAILYFKSIYLVNQPRSDPSYATPHHPSLRLCHLE